MQYNEKEDWILGFSVLKISGQWCGYGIRSNVRNFKRPRWSRSSVLAFGIQVRGFEPDRSRWIFQGEKNP